MRIRRTSDEYLVHDAPGIVVDEVSKVYYPSPLWMRLLVRSNIQSEVVALDRISFQVGPGEICAVVGPNGAGKTTTFRILVGLTTPTEGRTTVMGYDSQEESVAVRRLVGWMSGEERSLLMRLSCAENLRFHGRLQGLKGPELTQRIEDVLERVGLGHAIEHSVFALSAGMRARLQLARALLHQPRILILDEPTGSVDPVAAHELLGLIVSIVHEQGLAALISSHRLEEIEALHSRVLLLDRGRILYDGDLDILRRRLDRTLVELQFREAEDARRAAKLMEDEGLAEATLDGDATLHCVLAPGLATGPLLARLDTLLSDLVHVREVGRPLRDLLADMYLGDLSPEEPS